MRTLGIALGVALVAANIACAADGTYAGKLVVIKVSPDCDNTNVGDEGTSTLRPTYQGGPDAELAGFTFVTAKSATSYVVQSQIIPTPPAGTLHSWTVFFERTQVRADHTHDYSWTIKPALDAPYIHFQAIVTGFEDDPTCQVTLRGAFVRRP